MSDVAAWIASAATMIAAMMTAANLGTKITGWGFVVFTVGSVAWAAVGLTTGQPSLAITNGFLLLVNLFGVWRWLGRQARHETGSEIAEQRSRARAHVPSLYSGASAIGANVFGSSGEKVGTVVDTMHDVAWTTFVNIGTASGTLSTLPQPRQKLEDERWLKKFRRPPMTSTPTRSS